MTQERTSMPISVIIPTLQKNLKLLKALLYNLNQDNSVGEIIVIDNSLKGFEHNFNKVRFIIPETNLYVNPSWNLGVKEAKFDYIALFNDDVLVSENFCSEILPYMSEDKGIFGSFGDKIKCIKDDTIYESLNDKKIQLSPTDFMINGFGVIMMGHKRAFPSIPEEMKVYSGDNYLFKINADNKKQNYLIYGVEIRHYGNLSSANPALKNMKDNDEKHFSDNFSTKQTLSFVEKLFSIKTEGRHFVLRCFGLKFKVRRRIEKSITI